MREIDTALEGCPDVRRSPAAVELRLANFYTWAHRAAQRRQFKACSQAEDFFGEDE